MPAEVFLRVMRAGPKKVPVSMSIHDETGANTIYVSIPNGLDQLHTIVRNLWDEWNEKTLVNETVETHTIQEKPNP